MQRPQGYASWVGPEGAECDTFTCAHCNKVVFVALLRVVAEGATQTILVLPKRDPNDCGGFCLKCMNHLCGPCADKDACTPWEKELEKRERAITARLERARGLR